MKLSYVNMIHCMVWLQDRLYGVVKDMLVMGYVVWSGYEIYCMLWLKDILCGVVWLQDILHSLAKGYH